MQTAILLETGTTTLNSRKFTGYERDAATGLDYANARMYSLGRGRFVQPDPIGLKAADLKVPQSLNQYTYVFNDPVNHADPSGLLTIIIGGTGNGDADWGQPNTPFWDAVRDTFGEDPIVFPWDARIEGVLWPVYFDIYNGASDLIDFINTYPFKEGEKLNIAVCICVRPISQISLNIHRPRRVFTGRIQVQTAILWLTVMAVIL